MSAIEAYRAYLGDVLTFPIDALDRLGVPVWCASGGDGGRVGHGVGYGETEHDAERGALGEAAESLAAARWAAEARPVDLTIGEACARGAVHPRDLSPRIGADLSDARRVWWVPAQVWPDGGERLVPLESVATTAGEYGREREPLFPPITNGAGAGAGDDLERAVRHGLNELLQRDLNWSEFKALDSGRAVDPRAVAPELVDRLRGLGVDPRLKYSGEAWGVHAFHASALDADPDVPAIVRTATGEGADADPVAAGRKALYELCSSRARKRFFFGGPEALAVAPRAYAERFAAAAGGTAARELGADLNARFDALLSDPEAVATVVERITRVAETIPLPQAVPSSLDELEVLVVEMTRPGDAARVAKVIVPGLEAEVLSHHRLGPRAWARLKERFPGVEVDAAWLERAAAHFEPLYREPDRHAYRAPGT